MLMISTSCKGPAEVRGRALSLIVQAKILTVPMTAFLAHCGWPTGLLNHNVHMLSLSQAHVRVSTCLKSLRLSTICTFYSAPPLNWPYAKYSEVRYCHLTFIFINAQDALLFAFACLPSHHCACILRSRIGGLW